jgi:hypothetical protein
MALQPLPGLGLPHKTPRHSITLQNILKLRDAIIYEANYSVATKQITDFRLKNCAVHHNEDETQVKWAINF